MSARQRRKAEVLIHGVDVKGIAKLRDARDGVRAELGVDDDTPLVGTVANYHPKKDWPNLLNAVRILVDRGVELRVSRSAKVRSKRRSRSSTRSSSSNES